MGTRSLIAVYLDGQYRVAQYSQWDGYPSGQGEVIRQFFAQPDFDMQRFRDRVAQCRFLTDPDEIKEIEAKAQARNGLKEAGYPELSRDTGADILQMIYLSASPLALHDSITFVGDSLFCEWAYVIDLDKEVLEVYDGFHNEPTTPDDRFHEFTKTEAHRSEQYAPVKINTIIPLSELADYDIGSIRSHDHEEDEEEEA